MLLKIVKAYIFNKLRIRVMIMKVGRKLFKHVTVAAMATGLLVNTAAAEQADYVFKNAKVYTQNQAKPWAESVAVRGNKIIYVGSNQGASDIISKGTKVIDVAGKMIMPGFIDTHAHPVMAAGGSHAFALDLNGSIEEWLAEIASYVKTHPDVSAFYGMGFLAATFGPEGPNKDLLDSIVSDKPILIMDEGGHSAWVNSKALALAGINKNTPDPIPGTHFYQRDAQGEPTGWMVEGMAFMPMIADLGMITEQSILSGAEQVFPIFSQFGITTVYDAGFSQFEQLAYDSVAKLAKADAIPFRLVTSNMIQSPNHVADAITTLQGYQQKYSSPLVEPRVMKIHNDGTKEASTAGQFEDYNNQPGNKGSVLLEGKVLQDFAVAIDKAGFDIHIHAIGDRAVDEALDAFEVLRKRNPNSTNRYSVGHTELVRDQDLKRFAELNVVAQTTPFWFATDGEFEIAAIGKERAEKLYRFRKIIDTGGKVTFGSDFPVTGEVFGLSPLPNIEMGMTRKYYGEKSMPVTPPVNALLTLEEMIRGYTLDAAYQLNMETKIGSIEVGKLADLIVVNKNLFDIDVYDIHKAKVEMTMMNGKVVFERGDDAIAFEKIMGFPH
tara:strand:- start:86864 stop:88687 length:1824 start_codon:yes stop_codon:yes gene_type:complete